MERNAFIDDLYRKISDVFIRNIDDQKKDAVSNEYLKYLHSSYDSLFDDSDEKDFDSIASVCVKKEKIIHLDLDETSKMAFLFPDAEFLLLQNLSFEIAGIARAKKLCDDYVINRTKQEYIKELNEHADKVSEVFKYSAESILSEALMDVEYVFGDNNSQSFRTAIL